MEHESDGDTYSNWQARYSQQRVGAEIGILGDKRTNGCLTNNSIVEIGPNTVKSPGDLRRPAVIQTPVRSQQLLLVWKTRKGVNNNSNNNNNGRKFIKGIKTWSIPFVRYSGQFFKRTREEHKQMDIRPRKLIIMHKVLHPSDDVESLYVSRKEGGRRLASIEHSDNALMWDYIQKPGGGLITATRNNTDNTSTNRMTITRKQKLEGKQLYGRFKRLTSIISHEKTCT